MPTDATSNDDPPGDDPPIEDSLSDDPPIDDSLSDDPPIDDSPSDDPPYHGSSDDDFLGGDSPDDDPLDVAFTQYLRRCDDGESVPREQFLASFPKAISDSLRELIEAADQIGLMTAGHRSPVYAGNSAGDHGSDSATASGIDLKATVSRADNADGASTVQAFGGDGDDTGSAADLAVTLPIAHRAAGDHGPTLPFDLGDYELLDVLGRGGMGVVYRARQKALDREVAVKMIRSGMLASEAEVKRFYTEAQAVARLKHPGIVSVFQFGNRADHHFFSMEYIRGSDLQKLINQSKLPIQQSAAYVRDVAHAIDHAHQLGVLHRDLKPANVLIDEKQQIHVTDFGLAKHIDGDSSITASGDAIGTPHYMAPEQAGGHSDRAKPQSDIYALGAILFACLTGRPPIVADTVMQTLVKVVHDPAPPVRSIRAEVPIDLETIISKCLEKSPRNRYSSAAELASELDAFLDGRPIVARRRSAPVKAAQWLAEIPLFGALTGRRVLSSTTSHRRFQAVMLLIMVLTPILAAAGLLYLRHYRDAMPRSVVIGGGLDDGMYNVIAQRLSKALASSTPVKSSVTVTGGSMENRRRLLSGEIDLAPMQATAMSGNAIAVVAPLFYEVLYVLSYETGGINSIQDLISDPDEQRRIAVGPAGSGSRSAAELVFQSLMIDPASLNLFESDWSTLLQPNPPEVAFLCLGRGSELIEQLLSSGHWNLIPITQDIEISLQHPALMSMRISAADHPAANLPSGGIPTVGTTAFLAARTNAPGDLITTTLEVLYQNPPSEILIPLYQAAEWQGSAALHPAARAFYERSENQ